MIVPDTPQICLNHMKANIHPTWYPNAAVSCVCGNTFTTGSTLPSIRVEICSVCHPFYTGQQKLVDTQGQVERYQKIKEKAQVKKRERVQILERRASKVTPSKEKPSLKDLLLQARKASS